MTKTFYDWRRHIIISRKVSRGLLPLKDFPFRPSIHLSYDTKMPNQRHPCSQNISARKSKLFFTHINWHFVLSDGKAELIGFLMDCVILEKGKDFVCEMMGDYSRPGDRAAVLNHRFFFLLCPLLSPWQRNIHGIPSTLSFQTFQVR